MPPQVVGKYPQRLQAPAVLRGKARLGDIYIYLYLYIYIFHIIVVSFHFFKKQWILRFVYCSFTNLNPEWLTLFQLKVYMIAVVEPDHVVLYLIKANTNLNKETNN